MTIKQESGKERKFSTGAKKQHSKGKGKPSLFPGDGYLEICKHFEDGAETHEARNWEKGIPLSDLIDSLERHIADEKMGKTDESHDRALAWNAVVYLTTKLRIQRGLLPKSLDDMPRYEQVEQSEDLLVKEVWTGRFSSNEPTIEYVPEKGWQVRLVGGKFLMGFEDHTKPLNSNFQECDTPYYYETRQQAYYYLNAYLETLK